MASPWYGSKKFFFFFFTIHKRGKILNTSGRVQRREKETDWTWPGYVRKEEEQQGRQSEK